MRIFLAGLVGASLAFATGAESQDVTGTYHDTLVRLDGAWLFETRQIDVDFMAPQPATVEQFPPLGYPYD